jgi:Mn-dependent DtxR family transcriptional regulator
MLLENSKLSHKMEDYLEAISFIEEKKEVARVGEIADDLGVKSSSVNVMLKILSRKVYLNMRSMAISS